MRSVCHYCPDVEATHTCVVVDLQESGLHQTAYRRVPICRAHALELRHHSGRRVEPIEGVEGNELHDVIT